MSGPAIEAGCSVCGKRAVSLGLCHRHYQQQRRKNLGTTAERRPREDGPLIEVAVRITPESEALITEACERYRLQRSDLLRAALTRGIIAVLQERRARESARSAGEPPPGGWLEVPAPGEGRKGGAR